MTGPIPTTVIGGFLGAGKTTLVNHLLRHAGGRRITVLVNDFGELAIDQDLIEARDGDTLSLANGCACCSTGGDLALALNRMIEGENPPDHLLIEASGVADPDALADFARADPGLKLSGIVVLMDQGDITALLNDRRIGAQVARQIASADLLLLNKSDRDAPPGLPARLRSLAPRAAFLIVERAVLPTDLVLGDLAPRGRWRADPVLPRRHEDDFVRWAYTSDTPMPRNKLTAALTGLPTGLVRLKGFVALIDDDMVEVQAGWDWREIRPATSYGTDDRTRLVAIGLSPSFDGTSLDRLFSHDC